MIDINTLSLTDFKKLPLVIEGESKEVRYIGKGKVVIRFKPTIYSFTANRTSVVEGSDVLRLHASRIFVDVLQRAGIKHAYHQITDKWVLADLIQQPETQRTKPFIPADLPDAKIKTLPVAPPIEVIRFLRKLYF